MIYLKKGQALADNPTMVVYDQTGYYNDGDSIICSPAFAPDEPACRYEARFVAYGGMVYSISDPDELLAEIIKLDPKSLYGKDSQQVAVDKVVEQIVPQAEGVVPTEETPVVEEEETPTNTATTTPAVTNPTPSTNTSTTTSPISTSTTTPTTQSTTTPSTTATTTPDFNFPQSGTSTTTPETFIPTTGQSATTTPPEILFSDPNISTTTPEISVPEDISTSNATSSDTTIIEETPTIVVPPILETPTNTSTTTDEVVAFAKKVVKNKISKKLGL